MRDRRSSGRVSARPRLLAALGVALAACATGETPSRERPSREGANTPGAQNAVPAAGAARVGALASALASSTDARDAGAPGPSNPSGNSDAGAAGETAGLNDCCSASESGGCSDEVVLACVCEGDPFCCSTEYDALCVTQAISRCGERCDERPPVSDCCSTSDVPGCSDAPVSACICEIDPFCCVFRFDQSCVNLGISRCNTSCAGEVP